MFCLKSQYKPKCLTEIFVLCFVYQAENIVTARKLSMLTGISLKCCILHEVIMMYFMKQEKNVTDNSGSQEKNTPDPTFTSSVTASTWVQQADFFAPKSLTAIFF